MARILLLIHQPAAGTPAQSGWHWQSANTQTGGYLEYLQRDKVISECIDTIGGIAMKLYDNASCLMSTQCLYAAGLYCPDGPKCQYIAELVQDHQGHTGWPINTDLAEELRGEWLKRPQGGSQT